MDTIIGHPLYVLLTLGVLSHIAIFARIKPVEGGPIVAITFLTTPSALFVALRFWTDASLQSAAGTTAVWCATYLTGVILSMLVYRTFLHPLRHYPGPLLARLTQWNHIWNIRGKVDSYKRVTELHKQYGDFVRIGPNMISVADPAIVNIIHAQSTKFSKSDWYRVGLPLTSLHQMTDHAEHDKRRRHGWDKVRCRILFAPLI